MNLYMYGDEIDYSIVEKSSITKEMIEDFSCGNTTIDNVLKNDTEYSSLFAVDNKENKIISFIVYLASGIPMQYGSTHITRSAVLIDIFAVDIKYQHLPFELNQEYKYNLSDEIFCKFLMQLRKISEEYLYFEFVTLYSVPNAKGFYKRNCFEEFNTYMIPDKYSYLDGCIPMFMSL